MNKKNIYIVLGILVFMLLGFVSYKYVKNTTNETNSSEDIVEGIYESKMGVMSPISCHCFNGGYLKTGTNKSIPVCLGDDNIKVDCEGKVKFKGYYVESKIEKNGFNSCRENIRMFVVDSFECQ